MSIGQRFLAASFVLFGAGSGFAQRGSYQEQPPLPIVPTASSASPMRGVAGHLDEGVFGDRGLLDVAILTGESLHVLRDPGTRTLPFRTQVGGLDDLALLPGGAAGRDALVTVGGGMVQVWRWDESAQGFEDETLGGAWSTPVAVVAAESFYPGGWVLVVVQDASEVLHPFLIAQGTAAGEVSTLFPYPTVARAYPPQAIALVDYNANGLPDIAISDELGLEIVAVGGFSLFAEPLPQTESWLAPLGRPGGGADRDLAWVVRTVGSSVTEVVLVSSLGAEPPVPLSTAPLMGVAPARLDDLGLADLLLARSDCLSATVFGAGCPGSAPATFSAEAPCNRLVEPATGCASTPAVPGIAADLFPGGSHEVVLVEASSARFFGQSQQTGTVGFILADGNLTKGFLEAFVPAAGLNGATSLQLVIWEWPDEAFEEVSYEPLLVLEYGNVGGGVSLSPIEFNFSEEPSGVVLEFRGIAGDDVVSTGVFLEADDCETFWNLAGSNPVLQEPGSCAHPQGGSKTDYLGGIARLPRVPPRASAGQ